MALFYYVFHLYVFRSIHDDLSSSEIHELQHGLSVAEKERRKQCYGLNSIDVPVKPYFALFIEEVNLYI